MILPHGPKNILTSPLPKSAKPSAAAVPVNFSVFQKLLFSLTTGRTEAKNTAQAFINSRTDGGPATLLFDAYLVFPCYVTLGSYPRTLQNITFSAIIYAIKTISVVVNTTDFFNFKVEFLPLLLNSINSSALLVPEVNSKMLPLKTLLTAIPLTPPAKTTTLMRLIYKDLDRSLLKSSVKRATHYHTLQCGIGYLHKPYAPGCRGFYTGGTASSGRTPACRNLHTVGNSKMRRPNSFVYTKPLKTQLKVGQELHRLLGIQIQSPNKQAPILHTFYDYVRQKKNSSGLSFPPRKTLPPFTAAGFST